MIFSDRNAFFSIPRCEIDFLNLEFANYDDNDDKAEMTARRRRPGLHGDENWNERQGPMCSRNSLNAWKFFFFEKSYETYPQNVLGHLYRFQNRAFSRTGQTRAAFVLLRRRKESHVARSRIIRACTNRTSPP